MASLALACMYLYHLLYPDEIWTNYLFLMENGGNANYSPLIRQPGIMFPLQIVAYSLNRFCFASFGHSTI